MRFGERPDGADYYPAFPYPSFTLIADADLRAIKAYLFSLPAVRQPDRPHDLAFPFAWRPLLAVWQWLYFRPGRFHSDPKRSAEVNRGAYLVDALGHCGECHTPRNWLGATEANRYLAGTPAGPDGKKVPNITPDHRRGIGDWSTDDIVTLLATGRTPDADFVGGAMAEVVRSTARLTDADRRAIAAYLKSVSAIP